MSKRVMMRDILAQVAAKHRVRASDITGPRRFRPLVVARQEVMFRCRIEAAKSYPQIAAFLGGKDHTTIIHGVRRHRERAAEDNRTSGVSA